MLQLFRKLNKEKGSSLAQFMVVASIISLVLSGVSIKAINWIGEAKDVQKIANLRQISLALELYYLDNQTYPQIEESSPAERWDGLISEFKDGNYLASSLTGNENYDYQYLNGGENYILRVLLKNSENPLLSNDLDNEIEEVNCANPYYCIRM